MNAKSVVAVVVGAAVVGALLIGPEAGAARGGGGKGFSTFLFAYPPAQISWHKGEGLPDASGKGNNALHMEQPDPAAPAGTRAGAFISGSEGITLSRLGFDFKNGEHCSAPNPLTGQLGSPRYLVATEPDGARFVFACGRGDHSPAPADPAGWTRVGFTDAHVYPVDVAAWPGFGNVVVRDLFILFGGTADLAPDFTGLVHVDNLDVNGVLIGKSGSNG